MYNMVKKYLGIFSSIFMKKTELKILTSCVGHNYSLASQGGQLQPEFNGGDTLFQQISTNFNNSWSLEAQFLGKSRIGNRHLVQ